MPEFKIADMIHDYRALEVARDVAATLANSDAFGKTTNNAPLRRYLEDSGILEGEES